MKTLTHIALVALVLLGFGLASTERAHAQQTGTIVGTVEDVNGAPVSGIRVRITGANLIGGAREVLTSAEGSFRFVELPPGIYNVEATAKGFAPARQKDLKVGIGETVDLTFLMEVTTAEQTIKVTAKPLVDINRVQLGQSLGRRLLEDVPSGRSYQTSAVLLPGVVATGNPSINGGTEYSNQYLIDGVNTTDPSTNTFALNFNFDAIEELEVITGGFSPEYGNVTGGVINVVTRSGSNEFELDTSIYYRGSGFSLEGLDESPRDFDDLAFNFNVGGPIVKDHLWFFLSTEYNHSESQLPTEPGADAHPARLFESFYWLAKLTAAPDTKNRITLLLQADPTIIDNSDQDPTALPETETHQDQGGILVSLRYDGLFDPLVLKVQAAYKLSTLDIFPQVRAKSSSPFSFPGVFGAGELSDKNDFGVAKGCLGRDQLQDPASFETDSEGRPTGCTTDIQEDPSFGQGLHINLDTGEFTGSSGTDVLIERTRWQFTASAAYFLDDTAIGDHELKAGVDVALMNDTETTAYPGGASIFVDADTDGDGDADPLRARIVSTDDNSLETSADGFVGAFYILDNWKIADRLMIQPGLRLEQATYENFAGTPILDFFVVSPRLSVAWDPFADGRTKVHGGYGLFHETGNLVLSKFIGRSLQTRRAVWNPETNRYDENLSFLSLQGGESGTTVDKDDLEPMTTEEFRIGIERAICEGLSVDLTYIHRYTANAWEDNETNLIWNQAGTEVIGSRDGTGQQVFNLTSAHDAYRVYNALQATLIRQFDDHWSFNGSYTLSFYEGTSNELLTRDYDNPRQDIYLEGYLANDTRHSVKAQFTYAFDFGLAIGLAGVYETGSPYSKLFLNDFDGDFTNRRAPRGTDPGADLNDPSDDRELRLPDQLTVDLRASFSLKTLTGVDLELIAEIFNLLNASTVTAVDQHAGDGFGDPQNRQRPFQAALGLRYRL